MTLPSATAASHRITRRKASLLPRRADGKQATGYLLHEDSDRVVIATGVNTSSTNTKTGGLIQVWILVKHCNPLEAIRRRMDALVCGTCKHMGTTDPKTGKRTKRSCYVRLDTAPLAIYSGWQRGIYPTLPASLYSEVFTNRIVRWGAYGDPAYIPADMISAISSIATAHTGYTHQWQLPHVQALRGHIMASVDNAAEYALAQSMGWRSFRVATANEPKQVNEIICPASIEATAARQSRYADKLHSAGFEGPATQCKITCEMCVLCDGADGKSRKSVIIEAHGAGKSAFTLVQIATAA